MVSIGFSTTNKLISNIIKFGTKSDVSHAFVLFDWLGERWVLEAGFNGIYTISYDSFVANGNIIKYVINLPYVKMEDLLPAFKQMGVKYDFGALIGSSVVLLGAWLKKKWNNPFNTPKAMMCSELIVTWLQQIKFDGAEKLKPANTPPSALLDFLKNKLD
jgi:hypothetical protein